MTWMDLSCNRLSLSWIRFEGNSIQGGVMERFESEDLIGVAIFGMRLEPGGSPKRTVAGKIRNRRQITALHIGSFLEPTRGALNALSQRRPIACEMPGLGLP